MKRSPTATFVRDIDILYQVGTVGGLTDRELLGHFTARDSDGRAASLRGHRPPPWPDGAGGVPPRARR